MRWLDAIVLRLRTALRRDRANRDLDVEIAFYLEQEVEKNLARGLSPEEARRQARLAFGSLDAAKDDCRNAWGFRAVENLSRDVRHGLRGLTRAPGFTTMVLVTLGVGIGATTLVFAVAWALWLRPSPTRRRIASSPSRRCERRGRRGRFGIPPSSRGATGSRRWTPSPRTSSRRVTRTSPCAASRSAS